MNTCQFQRVATAMPGLVCTLLLAGCGPQRNASTSAANPNPAAVTIDTSANGSAVVIPRGAPAEPPRYPRTLSYIAIGCSRCYGPGCTADQRASAVQAAIIDALAKAIIEDRRSRGQSIEDFTQSFGPRLAVTHKATGGGYEITLDINTRGALTTFVVQNGRLTHPPHDLATIRSIFTATNGEYALLEAQRNAIDNVCVASVARYVSADEGLVTAGATGGPVQTP